MSCVQPSVIIYPDEATLCAVVPGKYLSTWPWLETPSRWPPSPQIETKPILVNLQQNTLTTPAIRRELRELQMPIAQLARHYHLSPRLASGAAARGLPTASITRNACTLSQRTLPYGGPGVVAAQTA